VPAASDPRVAEHSIMGTAGKLNLSALLVGSTMGRGLLNLQ
jgi:hypothetical protein